MKCTSAGLNVSKRQVVYNVVRGLHNKFNQIRDILKTQRDKKLDEVLEILKEREGEIQKKGGNNGQETAYATRNPRKKSFIKKCFVCGKINHLAKDCYHRKDQMEQKTPEYQGKNKKDSNKGNQNKDVNLVSEDKVDYVSFQAFSTSTYPKDQNKWIIDSG